MITEAKRLSNGDWYTITGGEIYIEGSFEYYILGEGDVDTAIEACKNLLLLLEKEKHFV